VGVVVGVVAFAGVFDFEIGGEVFVFLFEGAWGGFGEEAEGFGGDDFEGVGVGSFPGDGEALFAGDIDVVEGDVVLAAFEVDPDVVAGVAGVIGDEEDGFAIEEEGASVGDGGCEGVGSIDGSVEGSGVSGDDFDLLAEGIEAEVEAVDDGSSDDGGVVIEDLVDAAEVSGLAWGVEAAHFEEEARAAEEFVGGSGSGGFGVAEVDVVAFDGGFGGEGEADFVAGASHEEAGGCEFAVVGGGADDFACGLVMARGIDVDEGEFVAWGAFGGEFDIDGAAEGVPDFPGEGG